MLVTVCAPPAGASDPIPASPDLVEVANPACDVVVTPANAASALTYLNVNVTGTARVFCIASGD